MRTTTYALLAAALTAALLTSGCHSVSKPALEEAHAAEAVGEGVLDKWDALTDVQKKTAVEKLTRAQCSVLSSADGTPVPARFAAPSPSPSPATSDANTARSSGQ